MKEKKVSPEQVEQLMKKGQKIPLHWFFLGMRIETCLYELLLSGLSKQMFHYHYTKLRNIIIIIQKDMKIVFNLQQFNIFRHRKIIDINV